VIASSNHLLTQVKDNQKGLRRMIERGLARRKPSGRASSKDEGRNRWETRELSMFEAKALLRDTPWEKLIATVLRLERTTWRRDPKTGKLEQSRETVYWVCSFWGPTAEQWLSWIRAHWQIENGSHYVRDTTFGEDASRIRKNPDIAARLRSFAYNLLRSQGIDNMRNARWRAALDLNQVLEIPYVDGPDGKHFFDVVNDWSAAVICPACRCRTYVRGP
jgi:hypothetical protein